MLYSNIFMQYILPSLIAVGIAAILAFVLAYFAKKLQVLREPKIDDVLRHLAGVNCGACGYAGCDAFACALVEGKADINDCKPTSNQGKKNIADILGTEESNEEPTVAVVHCAGGDRCKNKLNYQGYGDCISSEFLAGGTKACDWGCMGLSSCVSACKFSAITVDKDDGYARVIDSKCTSCGACISKCPLRLISRIPASAKVYIACTNTRKGREVMQICEFGCIACGRCAKVCPHGAIDITNNLAFIDYKKCTSCGACVDVCPQHTIKTKP